MIKLAPGYLLVRKCDPSVSGYGYVIVDHTDDGFHKDFDCSVGDIVFLRQEKLLDVGDFNYIAYVGSVQGKLAQVTA